MQSSRVGSKWVLVVKRSHQERVYGGHKNRAKETKGTRQTSGRTWCRLSYLVNHCTLADFPVDDTCSLLFSQLGLLHLHGNGLRLCLISEQDPFYQIFNSKCDIWHCYSFCGRSALTVRLGLNKENQHSSWVLWVSWPEDSGRVGSELGCTLPSKGLSSSRAHGNRGTEGWGSRGSWPT